MSVLARTERIETERVTTLTSADVKALRSADRISFHLADGQSIIRAHRDREHTPTGFDDSVDIHAATTLTRHRGWLAGDDQHTALARAPREAVRGFAYHGSAQYSLDARTWLQSLRTGDMLTLDWTADNNSETLRDAGLHADELRVQITGRKTGTPPTFLIDYVINPGNSARMLRLA